MISTSTSPCRGPSSSTSSTTRGLLTSYATAARVLIHATYAPTHQNTITLRPLRYVHTSRPFASISRVNALPWMPRWWHGLHRHPALDGSFDPPCLRRFQWWPSFASEKQLQSGFSQQKPSRFRTDGNPLGSGS